MKSIKGKAVRNTKKKDLTVKEPAMMTAPGAVRRGFEEPVAREDLLIPRAKLLQALSPEIVEGAEGLKVGMIVNSITKEPMPEEFIPVFKFTNWVRFNPRDSKAPNYDSAFEPGAVIWRSDDPLDPKVQEEGQFGPNGERPIATKFLNFFAYFPGSEMPVIISFSNTSYKAGKQLLSLCQFTQGDMFSRKYRLGSKLTKNDIGSFYVLTVEPAGKVSETEFRTSEGLWTTFSSKAKDLKVHEDEADGFTEDAQDREPGADG